MEKGIYEDKIFREKVISILDRVATILSKAEIDHKETLKTIAQISDKLKATHANFTSKRTERQWLRGKRT